MTIVNNTSKPPVTTTPEAKQPTAEELAKTLKTASSPEVKEEQKVVETKTAKEIKLEDITEANMFDLPDIEARPLGFGEFLEVKAKDKNYAYRWINIQTQRQAAARAMGFEYATINDVEVADEALQADGKIQLGDVVLMKMGKMKYLQAIKYNTLKALDFNKRSELEKRGLAEGEKAIREVKGPPAEIRKKVSVFNYSPQ